MTFGTWHLRWRLGLTTLLLAAANLNAQTSCVVESGARVYIAPMKGDLDGFLAAELVKQRVRLTVTQSESSARYLLLGSTREGQGAPLLVQPQGPVIQAGVETQLEGNVRLFDGRSNDMVWSGEASARPALFSGSHGGGDRTVAQQIVKQLRNDCRFTPSTGSDLLISPIGASQAHRKNSSSRDKPYDGYPRCSFAPFC